MKQSETHIIFVLIFLFYYKISNPTSWLQIFGGFNIRQLFVIRYSVAFVFGRLFGIRYSAGLIFGNYSVFGIRWHLYSVDYSVFGIRRV